MERHQLLEDIRVLTSLLARAEDHGRQVEEADERDSHIEVQITRLEEAALKIERRQMELDAALADVPVASMFDDEREELQARLRTVLSKIASLRQAAMENEVLDAAAHAARPEGVPAKLRRTLYELVSSMHADPEVPKADIRPFQARLAELVRDRRHDLMDVANRIENARDYVTSAAEVAREVAAGVAMMQAEDEPGEALPYAEQRELAATRIEMARVAVQDALGGLRAVAHDWPELAPLRDRPDWKKLPFGQLADLLTPRDERAAIAQIPFERRVEEAAEMAAALALWIEELRRAVVDAPPPA